MRLVGPMLRGVAVVVRNNSTQSFFLFDLTLVGRREVWAKNPVPDIFSLVRSMVVIRVQIGFVKNSQATSVFMWELINVDQLLDELFLPLSGTG